MNSKYNKVSNTLTYTGIGPSQVAKLIASLQGATYTRHLSHLSNVAGKIVARAETLGDKKVFTVDTVYLPYNGYGKVKTVAGDMLIVAPNPIHKSKDLVVYKEVPYSLESGVGVYDYE